MTSLSAQSISMLAVLVLVPIALVVFIVRSFSLCCLFIVICRFRCLLIVLLLLLFCHCI